jgi:hypothetical protein
MGTLRAQLRPLLAKFHLNCFNSTWIWSCGWQLLESDCPEVGDPPSGSGGYDGEVVEVAA